MHQLDLTTTNASYKIGNMGALTGSATQNVLGFGVGYHYAMSESLQLGLMGDFTSTTTGTVGGAGTTATAWSAAACGTFNFGGDQALLDAFWVRLGVGYMATTAATNNTGLLLRGQLGKKIPLWGPVAWSPNVQFDYSMVTNYGSDLKINLFQASVHF
jgi:hypothetical protein